MSSKTQEISQNIQSANELDSDSNIDEEVVMEKLRKMKSEGKDIKQFMFKAIYQLCYEQKENENYMVNEEKFPKINVDEKQNNDDKNDTTLSMLIDFEQGKENYGMCPQGHTDFDGANGGWWKDKKDWREKIFRECMECQRNEKVQGCYDCFYAKCTKPRVSKGKKTRHYNKEFGLVYAICSNCRMENLNKLENEFVMDNIISNVIRTELKTKPSLSLDLLCSLPRATALTKLMNDIMHLHTDYRQRYCVFLIDLDDLKAINSSIGNTGADKIIQQVGKILKKYTKQVNDGKWLTTETMSGVPIGPKKCYCFRQGGDEYCLILQTCGGLSGGGAERVSLLSFYESFKQDINDVASMDFMNEYRNKIKETRDETIRVLKDRQINKILTAMSGIDIEKKIKITIRKAVRRQSIQFGIEKIGISVGLFVPGGSASVEYTKEKNWIECAEKAQVIAKGIKGKNAICVYYEYVNKVIPEDKTKTYLREGCWNAHEYQM